MGTNWLFGLHSFSVQLGGIFSWLRLSASCFFVCAFVFFPSIKISMGVRLYTFESVVSVYRCVGIPRWLYCENRD